MTAYITNGEVAWEIPPGRIADRYADGTYLPWNDWLILNELRFSEWKPDKFGIFRLKRVKVRQPAKC